MDSIVGLHVFHKSDEANSEFCVGFVHDDDDLLLLLLLTLRTKHNNNSNNNNNESGQEIHLFQLLDLLRAERTESDLLINFLRLLRRRRKQRRKDLVCARFPRLSVGAHLSGRRAAAAKVIYWQRSKGELLEQKRKTKQIGKEGREWERNKAECCDSAS